MPVDWRDAQTDWQAQRLNASAHRVSNRRSTPAALGPTFSLLKVSNPRIRVLALKKAEQSDEVILRLVELDGKPQQDVRDLLRRSNHRRSRSQRPGTAGRPGDRKRRARW